jgi:hypothetical protein
VLREPDRHCGDELFGLWGEAAWQLASSTGSAPLFRHSTCTTPLSNTRALASYRRTSQAALRQDGGALAAFGPGLAAESMIFELGSVSEMSDVDHGK